MVTFEAYLPLWKIFGVFEHEHLSLEVCDDRDRTLQSWLIKTHLSNLTVTVVSKGTTTQVRATSSLVVYYLINEISKMVPLNTIQHDHPRSL
jgi:hypothetical protein